MTNIATPTPHSFWCHECKNWMASEADGEEFRCSTCGETILCDECGQPFTFMHDHVTDRQKGNLAAARAVWDGVPAFGGPIQPDELNDAARKAYDDLYG